MYQGQLNNSGSPANGNYDFEFAAYNAYTNGDLLGGPITNDNVAVDNGLFTTAIDLGTNVFDGGNVWLSIAVSTDGTHFTQLWPLQPVLPVPYAIFATSASNLVGVLQTTQLVGTLPATAFVGYTNTVAFTNSGNLFAGSFSGNGGSVTNVSVTNLTGILADNQLPTNTAFLNSNQTFTANNTFNGTNIFTNMLGNSFSGSFFGNGLVGWIVVTGITQQADIDHGYLLTNSQLVTVTLPPTANVGDIVRIACASPSGWLLAQNASQSVLGNFLSYGSSWLLSDSTAENYTGIASSANGEQLVACYTGSQQGVFLSKNAGQTWSSISPGNLAWQAIASSSDGTKLVVVGNNTIYTSTNTASTWVNNSFSGSPNFTGVASSADGTSFVAVANGAGIFTNSGTSWLVNSTYNSGNWTSVALATGGSEFVATESTVGIFASVNNGASWTKIYPNTLNWESVAASANGNRLIAAVTNGGVYLSTNSGSSFQEVPALPESAGWSCVASSSDGSRLVAAVNGGYLYTSINGGTSWQTNATTANWSSVVSPVNSTSVAAVIYNSTTSGTAGIYTSQASAQTVTTTGTGGYLFGDQSSAVELQYIGNNQFMPVSYSGTIWAH